MDASLVLKIDSSSAASAVKELDNLTDSSKQVEDQFKKVETAAGTNAQAFDEAAANMRMYQAIARRTGETAEEVKKRFEAKAAAMKAANDAMAAVSKVEGQSAQIVDLATKKQLGQEDALKRSSVAADLYSKSVKSLQNELNGIGGGAGVLSRLIGGAASGGAAGVGFAAAEMAIEAAMSAAFKYYQTIIPPQKTVDELLGEQARLIGVVSDGYKDAASSADKFAANLSAVTRIQGDIVEKELRRRLNQGSTDALGQMTFNQPQSAGIPGVDQLLVSDPQVLPKYREFADAIQKFQASVSAGRPDVQTFREDIARIGETSPGLAKTAAELLAMTDALAKLDPTKLTQTREELERTAQIGAEKQFSKSLRSLLDEDTDANKAALRQQKIIELAQERAKAIDAINRSDALFADRQKLTAQVEDAYATAVKKANEETKKAADRYETASQGLRDNVDEMELQAQSAGRSTAEVVKLKTGHDLLRIAMRAGREDSAELRDEIDKLSDSYAKSTNRLQQAKLIGDISFERDQLGRDPTEAAVASRMRAAGLDVDLNSQTAGLVRFNEQLRTGREIATDFFSGWARDIRNGVSAIDALENALKRVADRLIDIAIQKSVAGIFGGIGSAMNPTGVGLHNPGGYSAAFPQPYGMPAASARGNVFDLGRIIPYAQGGIIDRAIMFPMANGAGVAGEAGPEGILPLRRGPNGVLGVEAHGGGGGTRVEINMINQSGQQMSARETGRRQDGGKLVIDMVLEAVAEAIASGQGPVNASLENRYGLDRTRGMST